VLRIGGGDTEGDAVLEGDAPVERLGDAVAVGVEECCCRATHCSVTEPSLPWPPLPTPPAEPNTKLTINGPEGETQEEPPPPGEPTYERPLSDFPPPPPK
jgi:hypothetical protein